MKRSILAFALLTGPAALAQSDFRPGYVVLPAGDTLRGEVDYRGAHRSARLSRFRPASGGAVTKYTPAQLRGYGFLSGRAFEARRTDTLATGEPVFLERLARGKASLYYLRDENDKDLYYLRKEPAAAATELVRILTTVSRQSTDGSTRRYKEERALYRGTLASAFADCPAVQLTVGKTRYTVNELTSIVNRYNECVGQAAPNALGNRLKSKMSFGLVVGGEQLTMNIAGGTSLADGDFQTKALIGGLFYMRMLPNLNEKLAFRIEALYENVRFEDEYFSQYGSSLGPRREQARLDFTYIRIPIMLRYTLPFGAIQPYAQLGIVNSLATKADVEVRRGGNFVGTNNELGPWQSPFGTDEVVRKYEQAVMGSIGVRLPGPAKRPLDIEFRAERGNGFSSAQGIPVGSRRFAAMLSYSLTK